MGVLGGAFNPPHLGHLVFAQEAVARLGLAEVVLVPTGEAPHKEIEDDPGADARAEMARAAVEGDETLRVDALELEAAARGEGPSYTHLTLEELSRASPDRELVLLIGADAAAALGGWREPERIVELARLAIASRPGTERAGVESALDRLGAAGRAEFVPMPTIDVSSTQIRERVAGGLPIRYLVPDPVRELIAEWELYRA